MNDGYFGTLPPAIFPTRGNRLDLNPANMHEVDSYFRAHSHDVKENSIYK